MGGENEDSLADDFGCEGRGERGELMVEVRFKRLKKTETKEFVNANRKTLDSEWALRLG